MEERKITQQDNPGNFYDKPGYKFGGWYVDEALTKRINPGGELSGTTRLYEKWIPIAYKIHYVMNGGINSRKNPRYVTIDSGIRKLYPARQPGKHFYGWFLNGKQVEYIPEGIHSVIRIEAKFIDVPVVAFQSEGGRIPSRATRMDGRLEPFRDPMRFGYRFAYWSYDEKGEQPYTFMDVIHEDLTLYANWTIERFPITLDLQGGFLLEDPVHWYTCETPSFYLPIPRKRGCQFAGWHNARGRKIDYVKTNSVGALNVKAMWEENAPEIHAQID